MDDPVGMTVDQFDDVSDILTSFTVLCMTIPQPKARKKCSVENLYTSIMEQKVGSVRNKKRFVGTTQNRTENCKYLGSRRNTLYT